MRISREANLHEDTVRKAARNAEDDAPPTPGRHKRKRRDDPRKLAALKLAGGNRRMIERKPDGSYIVLNKPKTR